MSYREHRVRERLVLTCKVVEHRTVVGDEYRQGGNDLICGCQILRCIRFDGLAGRKGRELEEGFYGGAASDVKGKATQQFQRIPLAAQGHQDVGARFVDLPNGVIDTTRIEPLGGFQGQVTDVEIRAKELLRTKHILNDLLAKHTGQTVEQVAKDTERDNFLTAYEGKEYGLVDEVIEPTLEEDG